jgi:alpha-L-fucosidase
MPNGKIQPEFVERLQAIGAWLVENGESIYGTRGGPVAAQPWGVSTRRGDKVYFHVLKHSETVLLPKSDQEFSGGHMMQTGDKVELIKTAKGTLMRMPTSAQDPVDNIVVLQIR